MRGGVSMRRENEDQGGRRSRTSDVGDAEDSDGAGLDDTALVRQKRRCTRQRTLMSRCGSVGQIALLAVRVTGLLARRIRG